MKMNLQAGPDHDFLALLISPSALKIACHFYNKALPTIQIPHATSNRPAIRLTQ